MIIITETNKLFMYKIILSDDRGYRGSTHFAKTRMIQNKIKKLNEIFKTVFPIRHFRLIWQLPNCKIIIFCGIVKQNYEMQYLNNF